MGITILHAPESGNNSIYFRSTATLYNNYETGPTTFDGYASEGRPFDAWWSKGPFDDWESNGSSAVDSWGSRGDVADWWQQWNKWVPGAKWEPDERWFNIDQEELRKTEKSKAQGRVQSSQDAMNPDEKH